MWNLSQWAKKTQILSGSVRQQKDELLQSKENAKWRAFLDCSKTLIDVVSGDEWHRQHYPRKKKRNKQISCNPRTKINGGGDGIFCNLRKCRFGSVSKKGKSERIKYEKWKKEGARLMRCLNFWGKLWKMGAKFMCARPMTVVKSVPPRSRGIFAHQLLGNFVLTRKQNFPVSSFSSTLLFCRKKINLKFKRCFWRKQLSRFF